MRVTPMLISAATLVVLGVLLVIRHREGAGIESEIGLLRERITAQSHIPVIQAEMDAINSPIEWQELARKQPYLGSDYASMKTRIRLKQTLQNLSVQELEDALDDLLAADLSTDIRETYAWMLIEPLAQLDPELALVRCIRAIRDDDGSVLYPLAPALEAWARRDPKAAIAWFDAEVAAGTFLDDQLRETDPIHERFEMFLVTALIESDPAAARSRASAMPFEAWKDLLWDLGRDTASPVGFASLVRDTIPLEKDRIKILDEPGYGISSRTGLHDVTKYMEEIGASASERSAIVESALRGAEIRSAEDFRAMRAWAKGHVPDGADAMAGEMLSYAVTSSPGSPGFTFDEACAIAEEGGGDMLLAGFLRSHAARNHPERAKKLAALITDRGVREFILKQLK